MFFASILDLKQRNCRIAHMFKRPYIIFVFLIISLAGCTLFVQREPTEIDKKYQEMGWKAYRDKLTKYVVYYPPAWQMAKSGRDFIQIYNFDPQKIIPSQRFSKDMAKTEIYWQELNDQELEYYPEIKKVSPGNYVLRKTRFTIDLNSLHAERWTGKDILQRNKKIFVYDPNAVQTTDITTETITKNVLYTIVTYTSGDKNKVPSEDILLLHNSFFFAK